MAIRVSGLASGMDIDSIVKQLMDAERLPLNKLKQKKQILEWKRDDYRSMNTLLTDFRSKVLNMKLSSSYGAKQTSSSNESYVTATASSSASTASYQLSNVTKLATSASLTTVNKLSASADSKISTSSSLLSMNSQFANAITWAEGSVETAKFTATGSTVELPLAEGTTLLDRPISIKVAGKALKADEYTINNGIITFTNTPEVNASIEVNYVTDKKVEKISLAEGATSFTLSKKAIAENSLTINGQAVTIDANNTFTAGSLSGKIDFATGQVTLNNAVDAAAEITVSYKQKYTAMDVETTTSKGAMQETFLFSADQSMSNVISKINSSKLGVTMFYDANSDSLSVTRTETGSFEANDIQFGQSDLTKALQLDTARYQAGTDAEFTLNGITTTRSSNNFMIDGVTFNLKQTFSGAVNIGITSDTTAVYDNIKSFVDSYNTLISEITKKTGEERKRDYQPLSDEEREGLSEAQAEKWDNIAKAGWLRNDATLRSVLTSMRQSMSNTVSTAMGTFKTLSSIGITTTANYLDGGKLEINETKLKQALEDDPESVQALFASAEGIASKLQANITEATDKLKAKAGNAFSTNATFTIGRDLSDVESRITRFEDKLLNIEDRYYAQFTAMEKAIQNANSQSSYLSSYFSS